MAGDNLSPESEVGSPQTKKRSFNRRQFLQTAAILATAGGVGAGISNEVVKGFKGITTDVGTFLPLYERHTIGIEATSIPADAQVYFKEFSSYYTGDHHAATMDEPALPLLLSTATVYENQPFKGDIRSFPDDILNRIASLGTEIMIGDVILGSYESNETLETLKKNYLRGGILSVASLLGAYFSKGTRRGFLKGMGLALLAWSLPPVLSNDLGGSGLGTGKKQDALKRITARIEGIVSDFHPEEALVFFRNAVMADKMLKVAEELKIQGSGKLPQIAFHTEAAHSGIEDFLQIGADYTRKIILAHPKPFLREVVDFNGGSEKLSSSRLIKIPKTFQITNGVVVDQDVANSITERTVVDIKLKEGVEKTLAN